MAEKSDLMWDRIQSVSTTTTPPSLITPLPPPLPPPASPPDLDLGKSAETGIGVGGRGGGAGGGVVGGGKRGRYEDEKTVIICAAETASSLRKDMHTTPLFGRPYVTSYTSLSPPLLPAALKCSDASVESRSMVQYSSSVISLKGMLEAKAALHLDGKVHVNDDSHGIAVRMSLGSRESMKGRDSTTDPDSKGVNVRGYEEKEKEEKEKEKEKNIGAGTGSESMIEEEEEEEEVEPDDDVPAPHTPKLTSTYKEGSRTRTWNPVVEGKGRGSQNENENERRGEKLNSSIISEGDILPVPPCPREGHSLTQYSISDPLKSNQTLPLPLPGNIESDGASDGKGLKEVVGVGDSNRSSVHTKKNSAASSSGNSLSGRYYSSYLISSHISWRLQQPQKRKAHSIFPHL